MSNSDRAFASLCCGAVGDSLGAAVEIKSYTSIMDLTNHRGVQRLLAYDPGDYLRWAPCGQTGVGVITDDTCMTAATVAALSLVDHDEVFRDPNRVVHLLHQAYLRWGQHQAWAKDTDYSKLIDLNLHWPSWFDHFCFSSGAGKNTIAALNSGKIGTLIDPVELPPKSTHSKPILSEGCGGMMRAAPFGWSSVFDTIEYPWGKRQAAITHGGKNAQVSAGAIAALVGFLIRYPPEWADAEQYMLDEMARDPDAVDLLETATWALSMGHRLGNNLTCYDVECLAEGDRKVLFQSPTIFTQVMVIAAASQHWSHQSDEMKIRRALTLAVSHSGDSDSVGAILGNVLGAQLGHIPLMFSQLQSKQPIQAMAGEGWVS